MKIGVLYSRLRVEEKWIFAALQQRGVDFDRLDDRKIHFDLEDPAPWQAYDAVLERSTPDVGCYAALSLIFLPLGLALLGMAFSQWLTR